MNVDLANDFKESTMCVLLSFQESVEERLEVMLMIGVCALDRMLLLSFQMPLWMNGLFLESLASRRR